MSKSLKQYVQDITPRIKNMGYPAHEVEKQATYALRIVNQDYKLKNCDPQSIAGCILDAASIGLTLNPAEKMAYLIPRGNKVSLEPSYRGLMYLAIKETNATNIVTQLVYEGDEIDINPADFNKPVSHKKELIASKKGSVVGAYSVAIMSDGVKVVEWMDVEELHYIRSKSESYKAYEAGKIKSCIWLSDAGEMYRKTVIKRISKYLSRGNQDSQLSQAIEIDNRQFRAEFWQRDKVDQLLPSANITPEYKEQIYSELNGYSYNQARDIINYLEDNQLERSPAERMGSKQLDAVIQNTVNRENT